MIDIITCPYDKNEILHLNIFNKTTYSDKVLFDTKQTFCQDYCGKNNRLINPKKDNSNTLKCRKCMQNEILSGVLICHKCKRWYPIVDGTVFLLTDFERYEELDKAFIKKNKAFFSKNKNLHKISYDKKTKVKKVQDFWNKYWDGYNNLLESNTSKKEILQLDENRMKTHPYSNECIGYTLHKNQDAAEIGCGYGMDIWRLAKNKTFCVGIELTIESIKKAQERMKLRKMRNQVSFVIANAENLPLKTERFDYVYSHGVIHHTKNTRKAAREIGRIIKSGKTAAVMVYYFFSIHAFFEWAAKTINKILYFFTKKEFSDIKVIIKLGLKNTNNNKSIKLYKKRKVSAILHNPYAKVYTKGTARNLFRQAGFRKIHFSITENTGKIFMDKIMYNNPTLYKYLLKNFGFYIWIYGSKKKHKQ